MQTSLRAVFASLPGALVLVSYFAPWIRIWEPETFKVRVNVDKKIYLMGTSIAIAILLSFLAWQTFQEVSSNNPLVSPKFLNPTSVLVEYILISALFQIQTIRDIQPSILDLAPFVLSLVLALQVEQGTAQILAWSLMAFYAYRFAMWVVSQIAGIQESRMLQLLNLQ